MDRVIYTAMTGANAAASRQAVLSNNLANASTNGFRAQLATYRAVPIQGEGASTRVFALDATAGYSNAAGPAVRTDRALDAMAMGEAWFSVEGLDGNEAYTRNGHFEVDANGVLTTGNGLQVLGNGGPITAPPGATISIAPDGTVNAKVGAQAENQIGRLKLVVPTADDPLVRGGDGLFRTHSGDTLNADDTARVQPGTLEGSNVNPIDAMVGMIQTARQFEAQMRLVQSAESNDRSASQLLNLQG